MSIKQGGKLMIRSVGFGAKYLPMLIGAAICADLRVNSLPGALPRAIKLWPLQGYEKFGLCTGLRKRNLEVFL